MTLIKEDWYPKPPTRESRRAALPAFAAAGWMVLAPWIGQAEAALATMSLEFVFLLLLFFVGASSQDGSRLVRWFGTAWALVVLGTLAALISWSVGGWWPILGFAFFALAHAPAFARRDRWLQRDMLMARGGAGFLLAWAYVFLSFPVVALATLLPGGGTQEVGVSAWGVLFYGTWGLADRFRVLVPPPPDAGPGWWKWPEAPDAQG